MSELTAEQLAALTDDEKVELAALSQEAGASQAAIEQTTAFRLKLAMAGAKAATYAVVLFNLLVRIDGRSALGKATANSLASFNVFLAELNNEIEAAKTAAAEKAALDAGNSEP